MPGTNGRHGFTTSPNSSEELDSNHGTPATKLSAVSPSSSRETLKLVSAAGIVRSKAPPAFSLTQTQSNFTQSNQARAATSFAPQDPFVSGHSLTATIRGSTDASKLSPIASAFTPQSLLFSSSESSAAFSESSGGITLPPRGYNNSQAKLSFLVPPPGLQIPPGPSNSLRYRTNDHADVAAASPPTENLPSDHLAEPSLSSCATGTFSVGTFSSTDGTSRSLMVSQIPDDLPVTHVEEFFNPSAFNSVKHVVITDLVPSNSVYVKFGDMRDANKAASIIQGNASRLGWSVTYIDPRYFALKAQLDGPKALPLSSFEAQILVIAKSRAPRQSLDAERLGYLLYEALRRSGDLIAQELHSITSSEVIYRAEFCSIEAVDRLLINSAWMMIDAFALNIQRYQPDLEIHHQKSPKRVGPLIIGEEEISVEAALNNMSMTSSHATPVHDHFRSTPFPLLQESTSDGRSLTARKIFDDQHTPSPLATQFNGFSDGSAQPSPYWSPTYGAGSGYGLSPSIWSMSTPGAIGQERSVLLSPHREAYQQHPGDGLQMQHQRSLPRSGWRHNEHNVGTHNVVDVNRIRLGLDVRTTIMLRNIPNKMTSAVLKEILDETSFGKYDFTYLRIDFANNCNVGYAFINFEDPFHIVNFVNARAGRRWNCYNSDKVAEISYATIQGRDCLVQKFRNSSVMLEQPSSRPKIWSTGPGPSIGREEPFPGPDNPSKMRRSVENAEHVGMPSIYRLLMVFG